MEIPHKVEIKPGVFYYVAFVNKFDDPDQYGECTSSESGVASRTILILKDMTPEEQFDAFAHELLHAIEFEYKLKIPHKLIYSVQAPLAFILRQNFGIDLELPIAKKKRRKSSS